VLRITEGFLGFSLNHQHIIRFSFSLPIFQVYLRNEILNLLGWETCPSLLSCVFQMNLKLPTYPAVNCIASDREQTNHGTHKQLNCPLLTPTRPLYLFESVLYCVWTRWNDFGSNSIFNLTHEKYGETLLFHHWKEAINLVSYLILLA